MTWKLPETFWKNAYAVLVFKDTAYPEFHAVVPITDSKEHSCESLQCACEPRQEIEEGVLHIVHNRFDEREVLDNAMSALFREAK